MNNFTALGFAVLVSCLAVSAGRLTRRAGIPGGHLLAAILVGALFGPSVLGKIAPTVFERAWIGDAAAIAELNKLESEHNATQVLLTEQAKDPENLGAGSNQLQEERLEWQAQKTALREQNHATTRWFLLTAALLIIGVACLRREGGSRGNALFGAWLAVAGGAAGLLIDRIADAPDPATTPFWIGAAAAVAWCSGSAGHGNRRSLFGPARFATLYTLIGLAVLTATVGVGESAAWPALALLITAIGSRFIVLDKREAAVKLEWLTRRILAPSIVAVSFLSIDLLADLRQLWVPILIWLAMSDLRWLVATIVIRVQGYPWIRAGIMALPLMGTGSLAVAIGAIAFWNNQVDAVAAIWIFLAAGLAELEGDMRGATARALAHLRRVAVGGPAT